VYFKKTLASPWSRGTVINKCEEPHSYLVGDNRGNVHRRNRVYIKPATQSVTNFAKSKSNVNDYFSDFNNVPDLNDVHSNSNCSTNNKGDQSTASVQRMLDLERPNYNNSISDVSNVSDSINDVTAGQHNNTDQPDFVEDIVNDKNSMLSNDQSSYVTKKGRTIRIPNKYNDCIFYKDNT
jgi:hypothetical protein